MPICPKICRLMCNFVFRPKQHERWQSSRAFLPSWSTPPSLQIHLSGKLHEMDERLRRKYHRAGWTFFTTSLDQKNSNNKFSKWPIRRCLNTFMQITPGPDSRRINYSYGQIKINFCRIGLIYDRLKENLLTNKSFHPGPTRWLACGD